MPTLANMVDDRDAVDTPIWEVGPGGTLSGPQYLPAGASLPHQFG